MNFQWCVVKVGINAKTFGKIVTPGLGIWLWKVFCMTETVESSGVSQSLTNYAIVVFKLPCNLNFCYSETLGDAFVAHNEHIMYNVSKDVLPHCHAHS